MTPTKYRHRRGGGGKRLAVSGFRALAGQSLYQQLCRNQVLHFQPGRGDGLRWYSPGYSPRKETEGAEKGKSPID